MITVKDIWYKQGYSRIDHLLDNDDLTPLVGQQFSSLRDAMRAAEKLASRPRGCHSPIGIDILFADRTTRTF